MIGARRAKERATWMRRRSMLPPATGGAQCRPSFRSRTTGPSPTRALAGGSGRAMGLARSEHQTLTCQIGQAPRCNGGRAGLMGQLMVQSEVLQTQVRELTLRHGPLGDGASWRMIVTEYNLRLDT